MRTEFCAPSPRVLAIGMARAEEKTRCREDGQVWISAYRPAEPNAVSAFNRSPVTL